MHNQARLQQYVSWELSDVQAGIRKGRETRDEIANIHWIIEKAREFQTKTSTSASLTTWKSFTVWITTNWKILKEMGIPDHLTCLLRNLYAVQEATVRTRHGTMDRFQIGKGICEDCILSLCLFNFYAEYIMWNARLDKAQAGIKFAGRNINYLGGSDGQVSACNAGDPGSIPGLGRSPGEGNGTPLQYSCLETPMDGGVL